MRTALAILLVMTTPLTSYALELYECNPNPAFDPNDYPSHFMKAKIRMVNKQVYHIDLSVPENDPYGTCGKTNVGQFNVEHTEEVKGDLSLSKGTLSLKNTYMSHQNGLNPTQVEESVDLKVISSTVKVKKLQITYGGDCNEYTWGIEKPITLECTLK